MANLRFSQRVFRVGSQAVITAIMTPFIQIRHGVFLPGLLPIKLVMLLLFFLSIGEAGEKENP